MAFVSWSALLDQMKDDIASSSWRTKRYQIGDREFEYRSFEDFMKMFREVEHRAYLETNSTAAPIGRTVVRGAGSW